MATTTRTLNPLHFEDLEPKRFEDLVRQLAYDFRNWRRLEATGRSGSDDGFDARGWEIVASPEPPPDQDDDEAATQDGGFDSESLVGADRVWLIQCKREKRIGPSKVTGYLDDIPEGELRKLHGILLAAPCDFSKKARDNFRTWCFTNGVSEWHLWGRAEIEDLLFRPANDHLLFAYFGFSLQIRRRRMKSEVRARLATKRRANRHLSNDDYVLLRDPSDDRYPDMADGTLEDRTKRGRWRVLQIERVRHNGVHVRLRQSLAFLGADGHSWDYPEASVNDRPGSNLDPWWTSVEREQAAREEADARRRWNELPVEQRGHLNVVGVLPFDSILAIDEEGDDVFDGAHVFTTEWTEDSPPYLGTIAEIRSSTRVLVQPEDDGRVRIFRRAGEIWPSDGE